MAIKQRILRFLHRKFDGYNLEEYFVMFVVSCIFLPFYSSMIAIIITLGYLVAKKRLFPIVKQFPKGKYPLWLCVISFFISLAYGNYLGALCAIGILLIFLFILFYRATITPRLFELIVDASCIISLFCVAWALMEYYSIVQSLNYNFTDLVIEDHPDYRINSTFFNANYYAMMLEFLILMVIYKLMKAKTLRRVVFYVITISCNMLVLYLSGCRTAWMPFVLTVPLMFLLNKHKKLFYLTLVGIAFIGIAFCLDVELFPRVDSLAISFDTRVDIWTAAFKGIQDHPLFGQGPLTYFHTYLMYGGPYTQHAHSVYIDPFLSFGIVGVALLFIYFYQNGKEIWHLYSQKLNIRLFSLIICFILTVMIHGILDYTIFWIQTSLIFFVVLSASSMYTNQKNETSTK